VPSDEVDTFRYELPEQLTPELRATRFYTFSGGCVTYDFSFARAASPALVFAADEALAFESRQAVVQAVRDRTDLKLCGADVPCPGGDGS
jgi:hypothetical protein